MAQNNVATEGVLLSFFSLIDMLWCGIAEKSMAWYFHASRR